MQKTNFTITERCTLSKFFITLLLISCLLLDGNCSNSTTDHISNTTSHPHEDQNDHSSNGTSHPHQDQNDHNTLHHDSAIGSHDNYTEHGSHDNHTEHGCGPSSHHGNGSSHGHHGIHVASWQFEYVKPYLIVSIFLIVAAICKLGE